VIDLPAISRETCLAAVAELGADAQLEAVTLAEVLERLGGLVADAESRRSTAPDRQLALFR
jgi:hypothetical protein